MQLRNTYLYCKTMLWVREYLIYLLDSLVAITTLPSLLIFAATHLSTFCALTPSACVPPAPHVGFLLTYVRRTPPFKLIFRLTRPAPAPNQIENTPD